MNSIFDNYDKATVYYHPIADRIFIFHEATFLMLPCLEREDGKKLLMPAPLVKYAGLPDGFQDLIFLGEL